MVQPVDWGRLFRLCEKITTIEACGHGTTTLLETLTPPKPVSTTSGGGSTGKKMRGDRDAQSQGADDTMAHVLPVFPKLTALILKKSDFFQNVRCCLKLYNVLMNLLRRRKLRNVAVKSLTIECGIITTKRANALVKLVSEFHCGQEERLLFDDFDKFDYIPVSIDHGDRLEDFSADSSQEDYGWVGDIFHGW
jgi:hypothetical protein